MTKARAGAGVGAQASKIALKIRCKLSLKYLETLVAAARALTIGSFIFKGPAC